jgi:drug/metabolite transporter (DMT)-like permease
MSFLLVIPAYVWLLISACFFAGGEYLSKRWGMAPSFNFALLVTFVYSFGVLAWLPALLHKNQLVFMGTLWTVLSTLVTVAIGFFIFHEKLSALQWLGVLLAFVAMLFLTVGEK